MTEGLTRAKTVRTPSRQAKNVDKLDTILNLIQKKIQIQPGKDTEMNEKLIPRTRLNRN